MIKHLSAAAALALILTGTALAQTSPPAAAASQGGSQGNVAPTPDGSTGEANTGGVTPHAREIIRENEQPPGSGGPQAAGAGPEGRSGDAASTQNGPVSPELVREIREQALAAEKAAASPQGDEDAEKAAADAAAIENHRQNLFARFGQ